MRVLLAVVAVALVACTEAKPPAGAPKANSAAAPIATVEPPPEPLRQESLERAFENTEWRFGRADGSQIAPRVMLRPDGVIEGYSHPNERSWAVIGASLVFRNDQGEIKTRFDGVETDASGAELLSGTFLPNPDVTHVLARLNAAGAPLYDQGTDACGRRAPPAAYVRLFAQSGARVEYALDGDPRPRRRSAFAGGAF